MDPKLAAILFLSALVGLFVTGAILAFQLAIVSSAIGWGLMAFVLSVIVFVS